MTSAQTMKAAAESVVSGEKSLGAAANDNGIAKTTLFRYVLKLRQTGDREAVKFSPNYKVRQILTDDEESLLADYLLTASKLHHGLSPKEARVMAFDFAAANLNTVPPSWILNQRAGEDWFSSCMKRHGSLSVRAPEANSLPRATSFNRSNVLAFFDNLQTVLQRHNFGDCLCLFTFMFVCCLTAH